MTAPAPAPWESVSPSEQLFVLITGANSGVGLGTGQRLIDEFLATRSLTSHLVLLPTTRSTAKSLETVQTLRRYAVAAAQSSAALRSRYESAAADAGAAGALDGAGYGWQEAVARIHVLSPVIDLCDLRAVYALADRLCNGTMSNPPGLEGEYLINVAIPKLDTVIFNAAYGGWSGFSLLEALWSVATVGIIQSVTWPTFKQALPTRILNEQPRYNYPIKPLLGEVFCACVFGHYLFAHRIMPLLSRSTAAGQEPGRIVWSSSIEAVGGVFDVDDIQCFERPAPYESAKRLTDIIALTACLPSVRPYSDPFFGVEDDKMAAERPLRPRVYLSHPGVVASSLFPVPWFLFWAYRLMLVISRYIGSPWHVVYGYPGAKSAAWLALEPQAALDALQAERFKWGSSTNRRLDVRVKKTEVEGWGWEGKPEASGSLTDPDGVDGVFRKAVGRKKGVVDATTEHIAEFERLGARCWKQLEDMRLEWERLLNLGARS